MKQVFKDMGLPIVDYTWFFDSDYADDCEKIFDNVSDRAINGFVINMTTNSTYTLFYGVRVSCCGHSL